MRRGETLKFFWRAKKDDPGTAAGQASGHEEPGKDSAKPDEAAAVAAVANDAGAPSAHEKVSAPSDAGPAPESNVITLQPVKLTERIAAAAFKTVSALKTADDQSDELLAPLESGPLPGQEEACAVLARALSAPAQNSNVLVLGPSGTGRRTAALREIAAIQALCNRPNDWIYVASASGPRLKAYALPHGQGAFFLHEIRGAIARAKANHERLTAGDDHRLGLEIIDEEFRHRAGKTLEHLKRRAEGQNIALVKTPEGFVLAPMHEGKVVRSDVFRSLPEALQRDVEAKIAGLEGELKSLIDQQPSEDAALAERISAFNRDAAARAVRPQFNSVRVAFNDAGDVIDTIESGLVSAAAMGGFMGGYRANGHPGGARLALRDGVEVIAAQLAEDFSQPAPLVIAHEVSAQALVGEIGIDGAGRLSLMPGHLMRANGGFLIVEAWRLAAEPAAWLALSAALETQSVKPQTAAGLSADADALPLALKVVLIADQASLNKLEAIDPGLQRHFPHAVRMPSRLPHDVISPRGYGGFAAAVSASRGLRPVALSAGEALHAFARTQARDDGMLLIDAHALAALLSDADLEAAAAGSSHIRASDVERAARRLSEVTFS